MSELANSLMMSARWSEVRACRARPPSRAETVPRKHIIKISPARTQGGGRGIHQPFVGIEFMDFNLGFCPCRFLYTTLKFINSLWPGHPKGI